METICRFCGKLGHQEICFRCYMDNPAARETVLYSASPGVDDSHMEGLMLHGALL